MTRNIDVDSLFRPYFNPIPKDRLQKNKQIQVFNPDQLKTHAPQNIDQFLDFYGMREFSGNAVNNFNTKTTKKRIKELTIRSTQIHVPITNLCIVCPPYWREPGSQRNNVGLFTDMRKAYVHGFDYNYTSQVKALRQTHNFYSQQGVIDQPVLIVGDWALQDIQGIRKHQIDDESIFAALDQFKSSIVEYAHEIGFDNLSVIGFREIGLDKVLPFDFPHTPDGRRDFMTAKLATAENKDTDAFVAELGEIWDFCNIHGATKLMDWRNWKTVDLPEDKRKLWVQFFLLLNNTINSRIKEAINHDTKMPPNEAGLYDALVKAWEYYEMAKHINKAYPFQITNNFDTKFPAAGMWWEQGGLNVVYLNPDKLLSPIINNFCNLTIKET